MVVVFGLASEHYGVDIGDVRRAFQIETLTTVAGAPPLIAGVVNFRGKAIPVVDLRRVLDLQVGEPTEESRVIVVNSAGEDIGLIVDAVTEVLYIPLSSVGQPSSDPSDAHSKYLRGIAWLENRLVFLLDLSKLLSIIDGQMQNMAIPRETISPPTTTVKTRSESGVARGKQLALTPGAERG